MKRQYFTKLPSFAPDYSGVCSALFELGGMIIIHDACGCTGNYTGFDEPRWYGSESGVYCSRLRQIDAVMGDDEKLICRILEAAEDIKPRFICVTGSPVPMVIGTDFDGIATEIENRGGIPSFGFATTGLKLYAAGAADAFLALTRRYAKKRRRRQRAVNLLGMTPLDYYIGQNRSDIHRLLEANGYCVRANYAMGSSLEDIEKSGEAAVNIVLSSSGVRVAEYFKKEHGIPYVVGVPVGKGATEELFAMIGKTVADGQTRRLRAKNAGQDALVMGDNIISHSIARCLQVDYGLKNVSVADMFSEKRAEVDKTVFVGSSEEDIAKLLQTGGYRNVIADPIFRRLLGSENTCNFIDLPMPAISSKLHWDKYVDFIGEKIEVVLNRLA